LELPGRYLKGQAGRRPHGPRTRTTRPVIVRVVHEPGARARGMQRPLALEPKHVLLQRADVGALSVQRRLLPSERVSEFLLRTDVGVVVVHRGAVAPVEVQVRAERGSRRAGAVALTAGRLRRKEGRAKDQKHQGRFERSHHALSPSEGHYLGTNPSISTISTEAARRLLGFRQDDDAVRLPICSRKRRP